MPLSILSHAGVQRRSNLLPLQYVLIIEALLTQHLIPAWDQ